MRQTFFIGLIVLVGLLIAGGAWYMTGGRSGNAQPDGTSYPSYPTVDNSITIPSSPGTSATQPANAITVTTQSGHAVAVKDFIHNGETVPDTVNPGHYYLAGSIGYCLGDGTCPSGYKTDDFVVTYNESASSFNIILTAEPLSKARDEVGVFMLDRLGVTEAQLCTLRYWVGTTAEVNGIYAGKNLGFAFCPGAQQL
jgi:hypothetical protein